MVQDHHQAFLDASRSIPAVGGIVEELRGYVSSTSNLLTQLSEMTSLAESVSVRAHSPPLCSPRAT